MDNLPNIPEMPKPMEPNQSKDSKPKRTRKPAGVLMPLGEMKEVTLSFKVSQSSTEWQQLKQDDMFSLDPLGSILYVKKSVSGAINLNAGKSVRVGGAAVYRVFR